jgi:hypothetical protein
MVLPTLDHQPIKIALLSRLASRIGAEEENPVRIGDPHNPLHDVIEYILINRNRHGQWRNLLTVIMA